MRRTQICLTEKQSKILKIKSEEIGISMAELIRRILDKYLITGD